MVFFLNTYAIFQLDELFMGLHYVDFFTFEGRYMAKSDLKLETENLQSLLSIS